MKCPELVLIRYFHFQTNMESGLVFVKDEREAETMESCNFPVPNVATRVFPLQGTSID
jgi:hypothetical protein